MTDPRHATGPDAGPSCAHLRHKGMYVLTDEDSGEGRFHDRFEATAYWCACTQTGFGPDRQAVTRHACCRDAGRPCCE